MCFAFILFTTVGALSDFQFNAKRNALQGLFGFSGTLGHILLTGAQTGGRRSADAPRRSSELRAWSRAAECGSRAGARGGRSLPGVCCLAQGPAKSSDFCPFAKSVLMQVVLESKVVQSGENLQVFVIQIV